MEKVDQSVLDLVLSKILAPNRLQSLMEELRKRIQAGKDSRHSKVAEIERQIKNIEDRQNRLLDAIETGIIELDETTHHRSQQLKSAREALLLDLHHFRRPLSF